jgi:hypothetical protein
MPIDTRKIELDEKQLGEFTTLVHDSLVQAVEVHAGREELLAMRKKAYKAHPEVDKKTFPWDGASNIVVPHVGVAVDAIVAKMLAAIFGSVDFAEVQIKKTEWEPLEKKIRDWINMFISSSGARNALRLIFHDAAQDGDAFVEPRWVEETRVWHSYDKASGNVTAQTIPGYKGVRFHTICADCVIWPKGYDDWAVLPWFSTRNRYTWDELLQLEKEAVFENVAAIKRHKKERSDRRYAIVQKSEGVSGGVEETYEIYQIRGRFPIPQKDSEEVLFEEVILCYSLDARKFVQMIYNPYFGKFRHLVKVPFLVQPHEVAAMGVAEQVFPFQAIASTAFNQIMDAATAANAGMVVTDPESSIARDEKIYPGKIVITEKPKETQVIHLSEPSTALQHVIELAGRMQQTRSSVSDYSLGLESPVAGSRATATGTTALIGQGQIRFNVSIDEMRKAIEELIYLTIQQEQQFRPEGTPLPDGGTLQWPQEDPRQALGLTIRLTSDQINREAEIQSFNLLFQVLNEYYARFMQAVAMIMNPAFPAGMKLAAIQVINASQLIVKRMVERFDIENVDEIVPSIMGAMQAMMGGLGGIQGMAPSPGGPPAPAQGAGGGGARRPPTPDGDSGGGGTPPASGDGAISH